MLVLTIGALAVLVEYLSIALDDTMDVLHFPAQIPALVVAIIIVSPESLTAIRAALDNDMQRTFNIALGSALSTVALTIPTVLVISFVTGRGIILGLTPVASQPDDHLAARRQHRGGRRVDQRSGGPGAARLVRLVRGHGVRLKVRECVHRAVAGTLAGLYVRELLPVRSIVTSG